jgi:hypothetical protein
MKTFIFLSSFLLLITSSCATIDVVTYTKAPTDPIVTKIIPLEKLVVDNAIFESDMIDNNLCEIYGPKYGYIIYNGNIQSDTKGEVLMFFNSLLCGVPSLFGVPFFKVTCNANVNFEIQNNKKETIAKFSGNGFSSVKCALYYGYNSKNSYIKATYDAANNAHKEIRKQLTNEVVQKINDQLKNSGTIK